jgi:nucleotide-binding universal stress UspA family protein
MTYDRRQLILVGVSRSPASREALSWAAEEARIRRARLHVLRVWNPVRHAAPYAAVDATPTCEEKQAEARHGLAAALRAEFGLAVPDGVTSELAAGVPERVLVDRSGGADLLVLGVTDPAKLDGRFTGPVVRACLARARCPVVVIGDANKAPISAGRAPRGCRHLLERQSLSRRAASRRSSSACRVDKAAQSSQRFQGSRRAARRSRPPPGRAGWTGVV